MTIICLRDVTVHKQLDNHRGQQERLASAERLVGGFAHQLRNPLAAISALVENLVAEMPSSDPRVEYTSRILNQVHRIEHLIRACLELGLDASPTRRRESPESIGLATIASFRGLHGATPTLEVASGASAVVVSREQIIKCLGLLLENAIDACGTANKIWLLVDSEPSRGTDRFVRFIVRDEGPGIDPGDLDTLFEPFFTTKANRVGLGLATAQALAIRNGGTIEVNSKPGDTQFILRLHAAEELDAAGEDWRSLSESQ